MKTINIIHGDSQKAMESMSENKYQLSICDPPYGIGADKKNSTTNQYNKSAAFRRSYGNQNWDESIPDELYFNELKRVSKNQIIWGANYFGLSGGYIYWNKLVDMPTYSDGELAYCSMINSIKMFTFRWNGMFQGNMKNKEIKCHPTQKPVALYKWLLKKYAKPGDKIFDSHGGSMSHAIACIDMGFDLDICEIDDDYYNSAIDRIKRHLNQLDLTRPPVQVNFIEQ